MAISKGGLTSTNRGLWQLFFHDITQVHKQHPSLFSGVPSSIFSPRDGRWEGVGIGNYRTSRWGCSHDHEPVANKRRRQGRFTRADNATSEGYFPAAQIVLQGLVVRLQGSGGLRWGRCRRKWLSLVGTYSLHIMLGMEGESNFCMVMSRVGISFCHWICVTDKITFIDQDVVSEIKTCVVLS